MTTKKPKPYKIKIEDLEILKKYRALEKCALEYIKGGHI